MTPQDNITLTSAQLEVSENALSNSNEAWHLKPSAILSVTELSELNQRSDTKGWIQLLIHLIVMGTTGTLWGLNWGNWLIAIPALVIYGFSLVSMFAVVHECTHRTAFATQSLNDGVAWFAGVLSFYNSTFYRRFHKWHHRYTQILGKDPELDEAPPQNWGEYLWQMIAIPWWIGKVQGHIRGALGQFEGCPYISETARTEVMRSTQLQLMIYGLAIALSITFQKPYFLIYWLLPLAVGQPLLRFILITEHTGCSQDHNPLTNTRTTLTGWFIRQMMWNMPFHTEHHLYASIPFHALPKFHEKIKGQLTHVSSGYIAANRQITSQFLPKSHSPHEQSN